MLQQGALEEVRTEFPKHFAALEKHPRLLIGTEVPSVKGEGMERLRDAADAADWQDAMKHLLLDEVNSRTAVKQEELSDIFATVHGSIDLFRNNADLIPGTKQFDRELADQFAALAKDYELRNEGKLVGYSVPVQPLINQVRSQLVASRAAKAAPAPAATPSPRAAQAAAQPRTETGQFDSPQAGFTSKAGTSAAAGTNPADGIMDAFFRQNGITI